MHKIFFFSSLLFLSYSFSIDDALELNGAKAAIDGSWLVVLNFSISDSDFLESKNIFLDHGHQVIDSMDFPLLKFRAHAVVPSTLLNRVVGLEKSLRTNAELKEGNFSGIGARLWKEVLRRMPSPKRDFLKSSIRWIERNMEFRAFDVQTNPVWNLDRIDQVPNDLDKRYGYTYNASGVNVYIMDSGIETTHVDFEGRASFLYSAFDNGQDTGDCNGHGTHVAGIVGSRTYGVAKKASLYNVKVLDCDGIGSSSTLMYGINAVISKYKAPAILSMSLGGPVSNAIDSAATALIKTYGVMLIVAAGNDDADACNVSPARVSGVVTVAATDQNDVRASYSNWGACVSIFAPGDNVRSLSASSEYGTVVYSGTSMAAPHVSGVVALWYSRNPRLTPSDFYKILVNNVTAGIVGNPGANSPNLFIYSAFNEGYDPSFAANSVVSFLTHNWIILFATGVGLIIFTGVWQMCKSKKPLDAVSEYYKPVLGDYQNGGVSFDNYYPSRVYRSSSQYPLA